LLPSRLYSSGYRQLTLGRSYRPRHRRKDSLLDRSVDLRSAVVSPSHGTPEDTRLDCGVVSRGYASRGLSTEWKAALEVKVGSGLERDAVHSQSAVNVILDVRAVDVDGAVSTRAEGRCCR